MNEVWFLMSLFPGTSVSLRRGRPPKSLDHLAEAATARLLPRVRPPPPPAASCGQIDRARLLHRVRQPRPSSPTRDPEQRQIRGLKGISLYICEIDLCAGNPPPIASAPLAARPVRSANRRFCPLHTTALLWSAVRLF